MEASAKQKVKILIVGGGGREHALAWKLSQSDRVAKIFVTPGNGGTHLAGGPIENVSSEVLGGSSIAHIAEFAKRAGVHVAVVGPEAPLAEGLGDELQKNGIPCFGPTKAAAQIESSKAFAKDFMVRHSIPTARYETFDHLDKALHYIDTTEHLVVVKASGLAAGKGVVVPTSKEEAKQAVDEILGSKCFGSAGDQVVLEELLTGLEVSCLAFSDGNSVATMPLAQDHKRVNDGDEGPNTGGMGAFAPVPASILTRFKRYTSSGSSIEGEYARLQEELKQTVIQTCVKGMKQEGIPFVGVLFAGIMLTEDGPKVLEYNCRFGDPETEALLPLLKTDLVEVIMACVEGTLDRVKVEWHADKSAVAVIAASGGYPGKYATGQVIKGLDGEEASDVVVFHAGTALAAGGKVVTAGGRVLAVTAVGDSLQNAVKRAYERIDQGIRFDGIHYRKDIARKAFQSPFGQKKTRLAVLGSTRGTVMQAIIDAIKRQELDAEISVVVSNKKDAYILQRAKEHNLKHVYLPAKKGASREEYDRQVTAVLEENNADLVLLIGYMRILSGEFVRKYQGRLYNAHPSLLPLFAGGMDMDVHKAVIDAKCSESGCTVHHVTEEVDAGPIIMQKRCPVTADETPETLKAKVQQLEGVAMLEAIKLFQEQQQQQRHAPHEKITYGTAGVNIDAGDRFVEKIKPMAKSTSRPGADVELGGFGGLFDLKRAGFTDPILVSGTDGVGTKLKLAQQLGIHNTVGIDLVAMCVNDVLVQGAEPLFFLDYYATGALNVEEASEVVSGIAAGCKESGCALIGGETAEMPGMYSSGEYDLAGFAVGAVERDAILPRISDVKIGDIVIGLSSSGVHSNGYSLVRHLINKHKDSIDLNGPPPFDNPPGNIKHERLANALLAPTKLYVKPLLPLMKKGLIKAAAHITGGGLLDNVPRVLPEDKAVELDMLKWTVPGIYSWLSQLGGGIEVREMLRTFNMGIGMVLIVENDEKTLAAVRESLAETGEEALLIGSVVPLDSSKEGQVYMQHTDSFH